MEKLSDWLKRIRKVEYADKGKKRLSIRYDDGGEDKLVIKGKKGERYVEVRKKTWDDDYKGRYRLIEGQPELGERNFKYCIFLVEIGLLGKGKFENKDNFTGSVFTQKVNFEECSFKEEIYFNEVVFQEEVIFLEVHFQGEANFEKAIFQGGAVFWGATFQRNADFFGATFQGNADFWGATFQGETYFWEVTFQGEAYFWEATFQGEAIFLKATFQGEANFEEATFQGKASFLKANFQGVADFRESHFEGVADFSNSKIKSLIFSSVREKEKFSLDLKFAQIEAIDYTDTEFSKAENRDTYLILKNMALKQNDQIRALDFYKQEMAQHREDLKFFKHPIDKTILGVERWVSDYGTDPVHAALWFMLANGIFILSSMYFYCYEPSLKLVLSFFTFRYDGNDLTVAHLFALVINPFLIYEIVKSLRKFSRKL